MDEPAVAPGEILRTDRRDCGHRAPVAGDFTAAERMLGSARDRFTELGLAGRIATTEHFEVLFLVSAGRIAEARPIAARLASGEVTSMPVWTAVCA